VRGPPSYLRTWQRIRKEDRGGGGEALYKDEHRGEPEKKLSKGNLSFTTAP